MLAELKVQSVVRGFRFFWAFHDYTELCKGNKASFLKLNGKKSFTSSGNYINIIVNYKTINSQPSHRLQPSNHDETLVTGHSGLCPSAEFSHSSLSPLSKIPAVPGICLSESYLPRFIVTSHVLQGGNINLLMEWVLLGKWKAEDSPHTHLFFHSTFIKHFEEVGAVERKENKACCFFSSLSYAPPGPSSLRYAAHTHFFAWFNRNQ